MLRINSGIYRGRKIEVLDSKDIRPLPSRGRESLINRISDLLYGAHVLDGFAGSGIFGIECLSREAEFVTFIERDRRAISLLRKNLEKLGIEKDKYEIIGGDIFSYIPHGRKYDIVFSDPPFFCGLVDRFVKWVLKYELVKVGGVLTIKHEIELKMDEIEGFDKPDTRKFASVGITNYRKK